MSGRGPAGSLPWADSYNVSEVDDIVERNKWRRGAALEILEDIQERFGWVSPAAIERVAELTDYSPNYLYGVVTFYDEFRIAPMGTVRVDICNGSACALNREDAILHELERLLALQEITDASPYELFTQNKFGYVSDDGKVILRKVDCVGACQLAPLFRVGREGDHHDLHFIGPVKPEETEARLKQAFAELGESLPSAGSGTHAPGDRFSKGNLGS
ncbi:MAG TPA: NAD(P)H-dependent oxidoreductase subunit E [Chloroflexota bacterium]